MPAPAGAKPAPPRLVARPGPGPGAPDTPRSDGRPSLLAEVLGAVLPRAAGASARPPRDTRADLSDEGFYGLGYSVAWKLLAGVALAGLTLPLLLGGLARRRRRALR